jgi:hypothetical protein
MPHHRDVADLPDLDGHCRPPDGERCGVADATTQSEGASTAPSETSPRIGWRGPSPRSKRPSLPHQCLRTRTSTARSLPQPRRWRR